MRSMARWNYLSGAGDRKMTWIIAVFSVLTLVGLGVFVGDILKRDIVGLEEESE